MLLGYTYVFDLVFAWARPTHLFEISTNNENHMIANHICTAKSSAWLIVVKKTQRLCNVLEETLVAS